MKSTRKPKWLGLLTSFMMGLTCLAGVSGTVPMEAEAASVDYPAQLMRISTADNSRNLNITGTSDKSALNTWTTNGVQNENWRFDYVGTNSIGSYFKITNMGSGRLITPMGYDVSEGSEVVIYGSESATSQHWYVTAVSQDAYGNDLYYKITNYDNPDMALTYDSSANTISLSNYSGADSQKWLLNSAGLQGFAGYAKDPSGNVKASTIGGLLGEVVEVDTFDELKTACSDDTPRTIIITEDISKTGTYTTDSNGRYRFNDAGIYIYPNKTIIGSYSGNSLYNVYFRTYEGNYGQGHNIIIRNIEISHDKELNNDNIWEFSYGWNFWIDHCTFVGHNAVNTASTGQVDWDKFLNFKGTTDFVTISDCKFGLHEYGVLLGYPTDTQETYDTYNGKPCVTLADNYYKDCITRAPGLMRYGYFHSMNNYVLNFDMGYTIYTACKLYSEANYFDGGTGKGSVVNDGTSTSDISHKYPGVYTDSGSTLVNSNYSLTAKNAGACSWRPSSNYSYTAKTAADAKSYCTAYSGSQTSASNYTYAAFAEAGMLSAGYVETPTEDMAGKKGAVLDTAYSYRFRNYGSGHTLEVAGSAAENNANVQQGNSGADIWTVEEAGDSYYKVYSEVGDGKTYLLEVQNGSAANGANFDIYTDIASDSQLFKFVDNGDGTYAIATKVTEDESGIGIASGSTESGVDAIQWIYDGSANQKWVLEKIVDNGNLIQDLGVQDTKTFASWSIDTSVAVGDMVFGDRDVTYASIPANLVGAEAIVTACDGKNWEGTQAAFKAGANITVYTALDSRVTTIPAWLSGWENSGLTVTNSKDVTFKLYAKNFTAGETVLLGTNGQVSGCVNYTVFAVPAVIQTAGDVTLDGVVNAFDLAAQKRGILKGFASDSAARCADADASGSVTVTDVIALTQFILGKDVALKLPEISQPEEPTTEANAYEPANFSFSGKVYLVGDSTVCEYDSNTVSSLNRMGWGMQLANEYNNVIVNNLALSGRSSRSFLTENNYTTLCNSIGAGDYLFIQFGHNDEKTDEATYPGLGTYPALDMSTLDSSGKNSSGQYSYEWILLNKYIKMAQSKGAVPVLVTPITRRGSDGSANYGAHTAYQQALIQLGQEQGVAVIDMTALTTELYTSLYNSGGADATAALHCYSDTNGTIDNTHLSVYGAQTIAGMIADQTKELGLTIGNYVK